MNAPLSKLVYAAALSSGLFLTACSGESCSTGADAAVSAVVGVHPGAASVTAAPAPAAPDATVQSAIKALRDKRLSTFLQMVVPPSGMKEIRGAWDGAKAEKVKPEEDAQFQAFMTMATAEGAEDTLFFMVKPYLKDVQEQAEGMAQMLPFMMAGAMNDAGVPQETQSMLGEMTQKISDLDLGSEDKARRAVGIFVTTARALKIKSATEMQALSFDEMMGRADTVFGGVIDILDVYGLSPEPMMKSMSVRTVSTEGDTAQMEMTFSVFGMEPETVPFEMERLDGRWFPKPPEPEVAPAADGLAR